jgi:hypothetical protein
MREKKSQKGKSQSTANASNSPDIYTLQLNYAGGFGEDF